MKAFVLERTFDLAKEVPRLILKDIPVPEPYQEQVLIKVYASGVCHTELDEISGRTMPAFFPIIPGHQVVGRIVKINSKTPHFRVGDRVGAAWINSACGCCRYCKNDLENLCPEFRATGRDVNGGYAEYMTISQDFVYKIPSFFSDVEAAPLLCAGAIGYRSLKLACIRNGDRLGLSGFGASAHLVAKLAKRIYPDTEIYVFARKESERKFALELGVGWVGDFNGSAPDKLDAIIDTTPAWKPVLCACENLAPAGRLIINAIRKEDADKEVLKELTYEKHLWLEKEIKSVANVSRKDVQTFIDLCAEYEIKPETEEYDFPDACIAVNDLLTKKKRGAKVLIFPAVF